MKGNLSLSCLIKEMLFPFITIVCRIWVAKIFYALVNSEIKRIARITTDLINMVKRFNLLLIRMRKPSSYCTCIMSLLKKIFAKNLGVFHIQYLQIQLVSSSSFSPFNYICECVCIFLCICVCIYV